MRSGLNTDAEDVDVKKVMDSWTLQEGYPVVTLTRNYIRKTAELDQQRFTLGIGNGSARKELDEYTWEIPITYTNAESPNWIPEMKLWMHMHSNVQPEYIIL